MNAERFKTLAEAYGANLDRWPAGEREAAAAFMAEDAEARVWLADAESLDALLDQAPAPPPSAVLREEIIKGGSRVRQIVWPRAPRWVSGAGLAAACLLGAFAGANLSASYFAEPASDVAFEASTAFDGTAYFDALETVG